MATFRVVHGTVMQGGQALKFGAALELTEEEAKHLNKHGEVVVSEEDFARLQKKKSIERELAESKESQRLAAKRKPAKAPEPDEDLEDAGDEADEDEEVDDEPTPEPEPAPEPPAAEEKPAKKAKAKKGGKK